MLGHRTLDTGHRTHKWFYILSNAAIHSIGQTINYPPMFSLPIVWMFFKHSQ